MWVATHKRRTKKRQASRLDSHKIEDYRSSFMLHFYLDGDPISNINGVILSDKVKALEERSHLDL